MRTVGLYKVLPRDLTASVISLRLQFDQFGLDGVHDEQRTRPAKPPSRTVPSVAEQLVRVAADRCRPRYREGNWRMRTMRPGSSLCPDRTVSSALQGPVLGEATAAGSSGTAAGSAAGAVFLRRPGCG